MGLINRLLHMQNQHKQPAHTAPVEPSQRVNRLEIALAELRERMDSLEGRHASLSASVRGRLGGRPNPHTGMGNFAMPLPLNRKD